MTFKSCFLELNPQIYCSNRQKKLYSSSAYGTGGIQTSLNFSGIFFQKLEMLTNNVNEFCVWKKNPVHAVCM